MIKTFLTLVCLISLCSCSKFANNQWHHLSSELDPLAYRIYLDTTKTKCQGDHCKTWVRFEFDKLTPVSYEDYSNRNQLIQSKQIRFDLYYDCSKKKSEVSNYLIYNINGEVIYTNWLNYPLKQYLKQESINKKLFEYLCNKGER